VGYAPQQATARHNQLNLGIMNKIEINIGLNNNPYTADEILELLMLKVKSEVQLGEWDGADEPTLVIEVTSDHEYFRIKSVITSLVRVLTQEAIAFRFNGVGELVFNENYTGERYPFDEAYFLTIK
jgi:hypothetical protein